MNLVKFPTTRYQGSKSKVIPWIESKLNNLSFDSVLDAFGGTGAVSFMFKKMGKEVHYNDILKFNYYIGLALIENNKEILTEEEVEDVLKQKSNLEYPNFISRTFSDIYFTDEENQWLDIVAFNISKLENKYKKAIAYFAIFQSCIIKRPYNLFHRKNLYVRTAEVERSFGNKKTWDTPFETHFRKFVIQANKSLVDNEKNNKSLNKDVFDLNDEYDLVYFDTPYISNKGSGVDYLDFYHFLEGIVNYEKWADLLDKNSKNKKIRSKKNAWSDKKEIKKAFADLFFKYQKSILVVSYRDDGIPSIDELIDMLKELGKTTSIHKIDYKYALSKTASKEVLIIAE
jgi:adenine-specific DNA methylase